MALHPTAQRTWDLGSIPCRWAGQQDAPRIQIQSSGLLRYKDLGLGFSPVGSRQQTCALLILPTTNPPARRMSSKPDQLSKESRCQLAECTLWQGPALSFGISKGLQSGVAVVNPLGGVWQQPRLPGHLFISDKNSCAKSTEVHKLFSSWVLLCQLGGVVYFLER